MTNGSPCPPSRPWWKDAVCYQVWPMSFKDSNADGHGDIQGIISKLDYLKDLGADVVWVSPTYKSPMKDFGYDISDWSDINPAFGTMEDMLQLIEEVHKRGMRILLDLVITHTSDQHPWFLESRTSKVNPKADWYMWENGRPGHHIYNTRTGVDDKVEQPTNWRACFGGSAWYYGEERDQHFLHLFLKEEPDLNWENPVTRKAIYEAAIGFWLDKGIDGFRIDTVNRLSKDVTWQDVPTKLVGPLQSATHVYINGPRSHEFLKEMRQYMDNHPRVQESGQELMLVGELPKTPMDDVMQYVHPDSRELSMVFDFDMVDLAGHDSPDEVKAHETKNLCDGDPSYTLPLFKETIIKVQNLISAGGWGTVFMENHDQCRSIARYATPEPQYYQKAAKLLCLMQTTLSGTEFIYQGQEIGMLDMPLHWDYDDFRDPGAKLYIDEEFESGGPEARENARIGNLKFGRDNGRTPVQWSSGKNAGFSDANEGECWIGVNDNCEAGVNVEDQQADPDSIWHFWKRQVGLRKEYREVFMYGSFECLELDNMKTFTYVKTAVDGLTALVCLNFSNEMQPITAPDDLLNGRSLEFLTGNLGQPLAHEQPLAAWEGHVYLLKAPLHKAVEERLRRFPTDAQLDEAFGKSLNI
ncbi:hypothetical protein LTR37_019127 [Vermiconidia calcicola]|uniref:Uncharacterized protein n=1 Tax=Vermiconidia calcicola TaxID=1690605 RepID=A0ACC3MI18_9PEZI|nr:hypothetical protein LTR37_019127 [Vermiconidia calcicola]